MAVAGSIVFVADTLNHRIVRFDAETLNWMDSFGEEGKEINQFLGRLKTRPLDPISIFLSCSSVSLARHAHHGRPGRFKVLFRVFVYFL